MAKILEYWPLITAACGILGLLYGWSMKLLYQVASTTSQIQETLKTHSAKHTQHEAALSHLNQTVDSLRDRLHVAETTIAVLVAHDDHDPKTSR